MSDAWTISSPRRTHPHPFSSSSSASHSSLNSHHLHAHAYATTSAAAGVVGVSASPHPLSAPPSSFPFPAFPSYSPSSAHIQLHSLHHPRLVHPSPVRANSYPLHGRFSSNSSSSTSEHNHSHHLPSPPLSTSTMPDPWGAERTPEEEDHWIPVPTNQNMATNSSPTSLQSNNVKPKMVKRLPAPHTIEVWSGVMDKSKGRDKVLKTVQYSMRTYLYVLGLVASVRPLTPWFHANEKRTKLAVAGLSLTRKCLLLLNPLRPAGALMSPEPTSARAFLGHLIDLVGAVADDIFCLSRLGLVSRKKGSIADRWANRVWFLTTITGLYKLQIKARTARDRDEQKRDEWQARKLLCDLVFVSYDIFHVEWAKEPVQCIAGLLAALISTGTIYDGEWKVLSKRTITV